MGGPTGGDGGGRHAWLLEHWTLCAAVPTAGWPTSVTIISNLQPTARLLATPPCRLYTPQDVDMLEADMAQVGVLLHR